VLAILLGAGAVLMAGCAGSSIADRLPPSLGGLPEGTPARPERRAAYPAVNDMPPPRPTTILTSEEQMKVEDELAAARNRNTASPSSRKPDGSSPESR
jgi:hypothetical protein